MCIYIYICSRIYIFIIHLLWIVYNEGMLRRRRVNQLRTPTWTFFLLQEVLRDGTVLGGAISLYKPLAIQ